MKTRLFAVATVMSAIMCCQADAVQLLNRVLDRGCGCDGGAPVAASSCCDTPSSCRGRGLHFSVDLSLQLPRLGLLNRGGACGGGCDTGCDSGCGAPVSTGCGCDAGSSCGASDCCGRSGLLSGLSGFSLLNRGGRGCGGGCDSGCDSGCGAPVAAPVSAGCGCDAAPVSACDPCARGGRVGSLLGRVRGLIPSRGCGCDSGCDSGCGAPVSSGCGCDAAPACRPARQICINVPNFGLVDRLRSLGNRGACGCDSGCDSGCGAPVVSSGCGCNGGATATQGVPVQGTPVNVSEPTVAPTTTVEPTVAPAGSGAYRTPNQTPVVDPNAFIIRGAGYQGR